MITPTEPTTPVRPETPLPAPESVAAGLRPAVGFASILVAVLSAILLSILAMLPFLLASGGQPDPLLLPGPVLLVTFVGQLGLLGGVRFGLLKSGVGWRRALGWRRVPALTFVLAAVALLAGSVAGDWLAAAIHARFPDLPSTLKALAEAINGIPAVWLPLVALGFSLVPAVTEEWLCRGILFSSLERRWGARATVFTTAAVFALLHCDALQSPPAFLMGLFLGAIRWRTGSVLPCMAAHAVNNAVAVTVALTGIAPQLYRPSAGLVLAGLNLAVLCVVAIPRTRAD